MSNVVERNGRIVAVVGGMLSGLHSDSLFALGNRVEKITTLLEQHHTEWQQWTETYATNGINSDISCAVADLTESLRLKDRRALTVPEAARHAGVKPATVRKWLNTGKLKGIKKDGARQSRWRVGVRDLDHFLERVNNNPQ